MVMLSFKENKQNNIQLYSFDIFDTLVTRRVALPTGIFAKMQEKLSDNLPENLHQNFYQIRIDSEKYARELKFNASGTREIVFDDIYSCMQNQYNLSDCNIAELKQLEIETEIENLVPLFDNLKILKDFVKNGKKVVLISDMYHSADTIRKFLTHIYTIFNDIPIYVSSEYKNNKGSGQLYLDVQKLEHVDFKNWIHYGDNSTCDIKNAKSLGIKAVYTPLPELTAYEKELLELNTSNLLYQYIIGSARLCRINKQLQKQDKYDFGASYTAPILYNYVNWIIEESLKQGFKTLYFVARDGYIPKIMVDQIIQKRGLDIKTKYIYGSRLAWRIPNEQNYESIIKTVMDEVVTKQSGEFLAYRLGVDKDKFCKMLDIKDKSSILNVHDRFVIKEKLMNVIEIRNYILASNKNNVENLKKYIKQEFDFTNGELAFVEINGSGRTQDLLSEFINLVSPTKIHTFFITTNVSDKPHKFSKKYTYLTKQRPEYHYLELLFRAPHGQTIGYNNISDKIVPIFEDYPSNLLDQWGFKEYIQGIKDFTDKILDSELYLQDNNICYSYFDYITSKCDSKTADILGDIPYLTIGKESKVKKAAPFISLPRLIFNFLSGKELRHLSEFPFITLARGRNLTEKIKLFLYSYSGIQDFLIEINFYLKLKQLHSEKIMFWGASVFIKDFIEKYNINSSNILGIIDRNPNRQGECIFGYPVYSPEILNTMKPKKVIMTIKNKNESIYFDLKEEFKKKYSGIELYPNIFKLTKSNSSIQEPEQSIQDIVTDSINKTNRLVQLNLSTFSIHQKTFPQFKNIHENQEIVILATGPSAKEYKAIPNAIHIGVNRAFQMNKTVLDYAFIQDYSGKTPEYLDDLDNYEPDKCTKFYGLTTEYDTDFNRVIPESNAIKAKALRYRTEWIDVQNFKPKFVYDIASQPLGCFGSVVFPALQFALWTNPKRIYLVGCDCSLEGYAYNKNEKNFLVPHSLINAYTKFKEFAKRYYPDTEIVSINPVGLKGIFKDYYMTRDYKDFWIKDSLANIIPLNYGENPEGWDPKDILKSVVQKYNVKKILDFGCGYGRMSKAFNKEDYVGVDLNPKALEKASQLNPGYVYKEVDVENQKYPQSDMTFAYTVFLHMDDSTLNNVIYNLAQTTNKYIVIAEILGREWRRNLKLPLYNRERDEYVDIMNKHGFVLQEEIQKPYLKYINDAGFKDKQNRNLSFLIFSKKSEGK